MADTTTRLDLPYPEASDEAEVHLDIQALAEALDAIGVAYAQGTAGARPAASSDLAGTLYAATDTEVVSYCDGDEWYDLNPKDAVAATASLRTLGTSSTSAAAGNDPRLLAGERGLKAPVRAVHTSNVVDLSNPGTMTFGGIACSAGDRVLLTGQSSSAQNGVYVVGANASSALTRATDMAAGSSVLGGLIVAVADSGTAANVDSLWMVTTNDTDLVVGTDAQAWSFLASVADTPRKSTTNTWADVQTFSAAPRQGVQAFTATGSISATGGRTVTFIGSSGQTLTLPAAAAGMEFEVVNIDPTDSVTVARNGTDTIDGASTSHTVGPGERATFVCNSAGAWQSTRDEASSAAGRRVERVGPIHGVQALTASGNISASGGKFVTFAGSSGQTLTLPTLAEGMEFTVRNLDATDSVTVAPQAGESIDGMANGVGFMVPAGGVVTVRGFSGGWQSDGRPPAVHHGLRTLQGLGSVVKATTTDPTATHSSGAMGDGWAMFHAIYVPRPMTLTGVCFVQGVAMTVADSSNQIGLYSSDGTTLTRVAVSTTDANLWTSTGFRQKAFSAPVAVAEGVYYIAALANWNGGTTPQLWGAFNGSSGFITCLDLGDKKGNAIYKTAEASLGASYTHAGLTANIAGQYFFGVY